MIFGFALRKTGNLATPKIVVIGASAGGVEALQQLVGMLPAGFPAAVFVVLHSGSDTPNVLPQILARSSVLPVTVAKEGAPVETGHITVSVPDRHLVLDDGHVAVMMGPKENRHRPSIDALFRSAAESYGPDVVGVVLTGLLDDGAAGLIEIKEHGGVGLVQDPEEALFSSMPRSAIESDHPDYVLPLVGIAEALVKLTDRKGKEPTKVTKHGDTNGRNGKRRKEQEPNGAREPMVAQSDEKKGGPPSVYTCPECSGTLWELQSGKLARYECRVGHAYSLSSLVEGNTEALEQAM